MNQATAREEPPQSLLKDWRVYGWRWLLFAAVAGLLTPVTGNFDQFWVQKTYQVLGTLPFGVACAVVFTLLQNKFNEKRARGKSWAILIGTWMGMKFIFVGILMAFGASPLR